MHIKERTQSSVFVWIGKDTDKFTAYGIPNVTLIGFYQKNFVSYLVKYNEAIAEFVPWRLELCSACQP